MVSAIGTALFGSVLQPMAAKAMDIIKDKRLAIGRYIAHKAVDKVVDKPMDKAMDKAMAIVVDKVDGIVNIERDISNLQKTLFMIQDIVQVAEEKQIDKQGKPTVFIQNWLRDIVDIAYEARDVLDDFNTFSSCIIRAEETSNLVNFISSFMLSYVGGLSSDTSNIPLTVLNRLEKDIRSVRERFNEKKKEGETFATLKSVVGEGSESVKNRRPEVGPFINKKRDGLFLGREDMKKGIMDKILHPSDDSVDVVVIWGMGGIGKTTLAQSIYNDESVRKVPRRWLCVRESKFCAEKVIREIVNDKKTIGIENLQTKLKEKLKGDRFLIVLDDVWDVDGSEWDLLFNPLDNVGKGGLIIITRRERQLCDEITIQTAYNLEPLSEEDSWSIFESCAYVNGKSDSTADLKGIGKQIVKKLNGVPLALKVVGRSLLCKDYNTWTKFLESKFSEDDKVMSALRWSYNHLPPHLKMCFTYCALFPKDHVLDKKVLVQMWMAHDLIEKKDQERPEDVGAQYFEELVNASLFQCVDGKHVMHDLIHNLAQLVSNGEFATANGSLTNGQMKKVRHITITPDDYSKIPRLCKIEKLLTLFTTRNQRYNIFAHEKFDYSVVDDVFKQLKSIRLLVLSNNGIKEIPHCISELRHLRYLDVSETGVERLPDSLCRLYNLQMIAARPYQSKSTFYNLHYVVLPRDIVKMVNLRHIRASLSTCKGVGKLTSLQELSSIRVCQGDNIRELADMQRLRGKLTIEGLENVTSSEDAAGALMEKQTLLDELELEFDEYSAEPTISAQVLDALGCPPNLTYLRIYGYNGLKPPSWMVDGKHKLDKLQTLKLEDCRKLESLPALGELTSLKHLYLERVEVKRLGDEFYGKFTDGKVFFPSLESLEFSFMQKLEEWYDIIIENSSVSFFPRLTRLKLSDCPKLKSLPPLGELTSLKDLCLWNVGVKRLGEKIYGNFTDGKVFFPSLESLGFYNMQEWEEWDDIIIDNSSVSFFPRLTTLKLSYCPKLESLPPLGELTSLKDLSLESVRVKRLGDEFYGKVTDGKVFFPSLESLCFSEMFRWEKWVDIIIENSSVSFFPRLTTLKLSDCPKLESLPALGECTSLKDLYLFRVGVKRLGNEFYGKFTDGKVFFPSLESLEFSFMGELEEWDDIIIENSSVSFFPRLTRLELEGCPKLESLPPLGECTSLKDLYLWNVGVKRLGEKFYEKFTDGKVFFPSLESLRFSEMFRWEKWVDIIIENSSVSFFPRLTRLDLLFCPKLESLPPLGELTSLKYLHLSNVGVKRLGDEFYGKFTDGKVFFPSLESLEFSFMQKLEEWYDIIIENSSVSFFPRLTRLKLSDCPKLKSLPPLGELTSLKDLYLWNVGVKRLGEKIYGKFTDGKVFFPSLESLSFYNMQESEEWDDIIIENSSVSFFPRLRELEIYGNLSVLPVVKNPIMNAANLMTSLSDLKIRNCCGLRSLPAGGFPPSLTYLTIDLCPQLQSSPTDGLPPSLTYLKIKGCSQLQSLPADDFPPSLTSLTIEDCPQLQSLPADGLPPSLRYLKIKDCELLYERYNDESGPDRHKINHIAKKYIGL